MHSAPSWTRMYLMETPMLGVGLSKIFFPAHLSLYQIYCCRSTQSLAMFLTSTRTVNYVPSAGNWCMCLIYARKAFAMRVWFVCVCEEATGKTTTRVLFKRKMDEPCRVAWGFIYESWHRKQCASGFFPTFILENYTDLIVTQEKF